MSSNGPESSSDDSDADYVPSEKELQKCKSLSEDDSDDNASDDEKSSMKRRKKGSELGEKRNKSKSVPTARSQQAFDSSAQSVKPAPKLSMPKLPPIKKASGLDAVLSSLGKKSKPTVFEQSRLDWNSFKQEEGISETLATYNKGKDGYLEKQDFLQRTDLRLFEKEKNLRNFQRSKK